MPFQNYIYINPRISISNLSLLFLTIYIYITNKTSLKSTIHITGQLLPITVYPYHFEIIISIATLNNRR